MKNQYKEINNFIIASIPYIDDFYLSICSFNNIFFLGIYNAKNDIISFEDNNYICENLNKDNIELLFDRFKNYIQNPDLYQNKTIKTAWQNELPILQAISLYEKYIDYMKETYDIDLKAEDSYIDNIENIVQCYYDFKKNNHYDNFLEYLSNISEGITELAQIMSKIQFQSNTDQLLDLDEKIKNVEQDMKIIKKLFKQTIKEQKENDIMR